MKGSGVRVPASALQTSRKCGAFSRSPVTAESPGATRAFACSPSGRLRCGAMTEDVQLDSVWAKLHRADERAQTLQGELASFVHLYEHCIEVVRNANATDMRS